MDDKNSHKVNATTNTQSEENRLRTGWEQGVGDGWVMQHNWTVVSHYGRYHTVLSYPEILPAQGTPAIFQRADPSD